MEYYDIFNSTYTRLCKEKTLYTKLKVILLDHYENGMGEITEDISQDNVGSISVNYQQGLRRSCSFTLRDIAKKYLPSENSWFWVNRKFKIYIGLKDISTDDIFWWSQGIFVTKTVNADGANLTVNGVDKFAFFTSDLNQHCLQGTYKIPVGTSVINAISDTITLDMGNGMPTDPIDPIIDPEFANEKLPYDIKVDANSYLGDILTEIATALGADIYYNNDGHLIVTKDISDDYNHFPHLWDYIDLEPELLSPKIDYELGNVINTYLVRGNNTTGEIHSYIAKNDNPQSPVRISAIGVKAGEIEETAMGYNEIRCKAYAEYKLKKKSIIALSVNFNSTLIPHLDVNNIIGITYNNYNLDKEDLVIQSLTIPMGVGEMSISATNIAWLPSYTESASISMVS